MAKTLQVNESRQVAMGAPALLAALDVYGPQAVGVPETDADGSATLTRLDRQGNVINFAFEFDQGVKARGQGAGTINVTALGADTTRLDLRGSITLEGLAAKSPTFVLNKMLKREIDKLLTDMINELKGPQQGGLGAA